MGGFLEFGRKLMGRAGDEKSSGGSASSGLNPQPGEIIFTDRHVAMSKKEIITETAVASARPINGAKKDLRVNGTSVPETAFTKSALLEGRTPVFPRKGDIFENPKTGGKIEVEGITEEKGEKDISFTEYNPEGVILHDKRVVQKPKKNFDVAVGVKGMEKIDPIKEQHPEFYAKYEEEMAKTEFAFTRESVKIRMRMDGWKETVENIPGNKSGKRFDLIRLHQLKIKIEDAIAKFNELDDRQVNDGRKKMQLFVEMRAFGTEIPSDIQLSDEELKEALMKEYGASGEELKTLEKEHGSEEPNIQLVEEGYQKIIYKKTIERLNKRADQLQKKYDNALVRRGVSFAGSALPATEFGERVNALLHSINEQSSEKETEKVFADLDELEGQMFEERDETDGNGGREKKRKGKLARKIHRGGFDREESIRPGRGSEDKGVGHIAGKRLEGAVELGETGGFQEETGDTGKKDIILEQTGHQLEDFENFKILKGRLYDFFHTDFPTTLAQTVTFTGLNDLRQGKRMAGGTQPGRAVREYEVNRHCWSNELHTAYHNLSKADRQVADELIAKSSRSPLNEIEKRIVEKKRELKDVLKDFLASFDFPDKLGGKAAEIEAVIGDTAGNEESLGNIGKSRRVSIGGEKKMMRRFLSAEMFLPAYVDDPSAIGYLNSILDQEALVEGREEEIFAVWRKKMDAAIRKRKAAEKRRPPSFESIVPKDKQQEIVDEMNRFISDGLELIDSYVSETEGHRLNEVFEGDHPVFKKIIEEKIEPLLVKVSANIVRIGKAYGATIKTGAADTAVAMILKKGTELLSAAMKRRVSPDMKKKN